MDFALIMDIVVVAVILISGAVAFLRGFVREVLTILGLIGASMTALIAGPKLSPGIERWLTSDIAADDLDSAKMWGMIPYDIAAGFFAYAGLFVITLVVLSLISHWIAKSVHAIGLGPVDRSLGVVFGIVRGIILIGLLYMPFHILMDQKDKDEWFGSSNTFSYVEQSSQFMTSFMPKSWSLTNEEDETEELDPLKEISGENDEFDPNPEIGTDEENVEDQDQEQTQGYDTIERQAIEALIEHQDKIKDIIQGTESTSNDTE